ncbi:aldo/keto reductase [Flavobacteriaceae bacterium S0825]|uniref:aldo/keto reductase n=1 Tax=Gaetbulibacter sp. S0825 TaxID=2720084 RepID=UPI00142F4B21|nr:aldo/keto reductase [Gaetbulibacter sp. S0825]MCK0108281.1 aldo/keto reductase [Flavobacteriaceae bacterium S0825]NIX63917.1 aldo/keto reductase [Gaetbulibacter sp. S0825]
MVNKLILGTAQLGLDYGINNQLGKPSIEQSFEILNTAFENGIRILDTAEAYGNSTEIIGRFTKEYPKKKFKIISKLATTADLSKKDLSTHITESCHILNIDQFHGYMFHNYSSFKQNINLYDELLTLKSKGLILNTGISLYTNEELLDIIENFNNFDFIQIPFNLLDNHLRRNALILKAKEKDIAIHTRSTFLQGLFFMDSSALPDRLTPLKQYLQELEKIKADNNLTTEVLALQYVVQKNYIDQILIGVETPQHVIDNVALCKAHAKIPHDCIDKINVIETVLLNPSNWS